MCTRSKSFDDANPSTLRAQELGKLYRRLSSVLDYTVRQTDRDEIRRKLAWGSDDEVFKSGDQHSFGKSTICESAREGDMTLQLCYMNHSHAHAHAEAEVTSESAEATSSPVKHHCCQSRYHNVSWARGLADNPMSTSSLSSSSSSSMSSSCASLSSPTRTLEGPSSSTSLPFSSGSSSSNNNNNNDNDDDDDDDEVDGRQSSGQDRGSSSSRTRHQQQNQNRGRGGSNPGGGGGGGSSGDPGRPLVPPFQTSASASSSSNSPATFSPFSSSLPLSLGSPSVETLAQRQHRLQQEARMALAQASVMARMQLEVERRNKRRYTCADIEWASDPADWRKLKIPRQVLQEMNFAQLQVLVNDLHGQIEGFNEELVQLLIEKDDLHMEQDSMLVDIEDLNSFAQHLTETNNNKTSLNNHNSSHKKTPTASSPAASTSTATVVSRRLKWSRCPGGNLKKTVESSSTSPSTSTSSSTSAMVKRKVNDAVNGNE